MLDLTRLSATLEPAAAAAVEAARQLPARLERARAALGEAEKWLTPGLVEAARRDRIRLAAGAEPELARPRAPAPPPPAYRVLAADGSQIEPDYHSGFELYLINVGAVAFRYGGPRGSHARLLSRPSVRGGEGPAADPEADDAGSRPYARRTEVERMIAEFDQLADLIRAEADPDTPTVALLDGPLVAYWVIRLEPPAVRERAIRAVRELHRAAREREVALAGYISRTRSAEVLNMLRFSRCGGVRERQELCAGCAAALRGRREEPAPCSPELDGVLDRHLFGGPERAVLAPGQRTALFEIEAALERAGGDEPAGTLSLRFFYLRSESDLARVEVPEWVAEHPARLALLHGALLDQIALGRGYPLALAEAHEQAVVRAPDRQLFYELLGRRYARAGLRPAGSPKARAKRQPLG